MAKNVNSNSTNGVIANRLKQLRLQKGWSQIRAAKECGLSLKTYRTYELAEVIPYRVKSIEALSRGFGITPDYFLTSMDSPIISSMFSSNPEDHMSSIKETTRNVMTQINALFSGDELSLKEKSVLMSAISEMYFKSMNRFLDSSDEELDDEDDENECFGTLRKEENSTFLQFQVLKLNNKAKYTGDTK